MASVSSEVDQMKKRIPSLLLALVMALALCATAAAEGTQTGYLAGYDADGRMVGLRALTADGAAAAISGATNYKLLRVDSDLIPQAPALAFAPSAGVVRQVDGRVCICYDGPQGLAVKLPVTQRVTGQVTGFNTAGQLRVNGERYSATRLTVEGCDIPISPKGFQQVMLSGAIYDFYLDPDGAICWIEQHEDGPHQLCVVLSAWHDASGLQVEILTAGRTVKTIPVTRLNGNAIGDGPDCVSLDDALAQVEADCGKAFYTYSLQAGDGCYHLVRSGKDSPVDTGFTWDESYVIPEDSAIQPDADFTFGAIPCLADERTVFWVAVGAAGDKTFLSYRGFQQLPFAQAKGCVITGADGVADNVYLDTPYFVVEPPKGYVMVVNKWWDRDYATGAYRLNIVGADGNTTTLRVPKGIVDAVEKDSMELDRFADNAYVGKLCRVTAMDYNEVALGLEPAETYEVQALGGGSLTTDAGTWRYDERTCRINIELAVDPPNLVLPGEVPCIGFSNCGNFSLYEAFDPGQVGPDQPYHSVRAAVIPNAGDPALADYVYIIRILN